MRIATANPCSISSAPRPMTWQPTIFSVGPTQTSFMSVRVLRAVSAWYMGVNSAT